MYLFCNNLDYLERLKTNIDLVDYWKYCSKFT